LSLFGPVVSDPRLPAVKTGLRRISAQLGEARNLDVFLQGLAAEAERRPGEPGLAEFTAHVRRQREAAYDAAIATLRSRRFRVFLLDLVAWIETGPWLASEANAAIRTRPVEDFAADLLRRRRRKVRRNGRHLDRLDPPARHEVRIDAKKLRYASEFFGSLAQDGKGRRRHKAFVSALEDLQEHLGALNDAATGADLSTQLLASFREAWPGNGAGNVLPGGDAVGPSDSELDDLVARAVKAHAAFSDAKSFLR
jgi:CHAD domain-containing protein